MLVLNENRDAAYIHYLLQTADERIEQRIEGGGCGKRAAKVQQAVAHVVTLAVKQPVHLSLQKVLPRGSNHNDGGHCHNRYHHAQGELSRGEAISSERVESGEVDDR